MLKITPDPPQDRTITHTAEKAFGPLDSTNRPFFTVREGIPVEDALEHVVMLLNCAEATGWDTAEHLELNDKALALTIIQSVESARALIEALLDSVKA
ncbi:DUF3077 domain-containing protein [Pseudomonas sp. LS1212]|uniref:DUF3077 domain-containing protein n=1 Tax=Pseudomonas sp. LS1212 TaxID=2972478 RepID=UPI00215CD7E3|nr:DUF3077 domain-containing protein [Pseudomonas sp. LS1212]UVJ43658.1 DUF3077 domain-containing protein [Pseudomonas sp. LS1212]